MINKIYTQHFMTGQFYESINGVHTPCPVKYVFVVLLAATANQAIIAAVAGKEIYVLEGNIASTGALSAITFKNGATNIKGYNVPINTAATPNVQIPLSSYPIMKTSVNTALNADTAAGGALWVSLTYVEVTA